MTDLNYEQIIALVGMSIWFVYPIGMFISLMRQDREALPAPLNTNLKIFEHKKMLYENELEQTEHLILEDKLINDYNIETLNTDEDFIHPHQGIGSSHSHHLVDH